MIRRYQDLTFRARVSDVLCQRSQKARKCNDKFPLPLCTEGRGHPEMGEVRGAPTVQGTKPGIEGVAPGRFCSITFHLHSSLSGPMAYHI